MRAWPLVLALLLVVGGIRFASAEISYPYVTDEKSQVLFGDTVSVTPYQGLENYTHDFVNGYLHITFTYTHHIFFYASYPPYIYITDTDPRTTSSPTQKSLAAAYWILPFPRTPTDWYTYDIQFDAAGYRVVVKQEGTIVFSDEYTAVAGLASSDWVSLANLYPMSSSGSPTPFSMAFAPLSPVAEPLPDPCATPGACASNVLFLPGIEGSRLYAGRSCGGSGEEKLWDPVGDGAIKILRGVGDDKVKKLFLNADGSSVCSDIYTKTGDIIDAVGGSNIYKSFIEEMNGMKGDGTISDWRAVSYDWRLSLDDLLTKGSATNGHISYTTATSTPYIEQTLRELAASSKTKKVTIVAHSNGGLVVKALALKLGDTEAARLIDKMILVGVMQNGAPMSIGATLFGYNQGIYYHAVPILSDATARALALNAPMAYHLLPSEDYLESTASDTAHPVIRFSGDGYAKEKAAYGTTIANRSALDDFLLAKEGGRTKPAASNIKEAEILNPTLIDYANAKHAALDSWAPPAGIEVTQIAGWGDDSTVAGIDFYTPPPISVSSSLDPLRLYRPVFTEDGDGTVPVPSALLMASSTNVKRYWVDLNSYFKATTIRRNHRDILEILPLEDFIKNIIQNSTSTVPSYISSTQPSPIIEDKKLTFFLHSPLTLELTDASGNHTGPAVDGSIDQQIPGATYGTFGDVQYISAPAGGSYKLSLRGQASGTFSLDMQESTGGVVTASSTIANVPIATSTLVSMSISGGIATASALSVDENGDGQNIITVTPRIGETVSYQPPTPAPAPAPAPAPGAPVSRGGGGGGRGLTPVIANPVQQSVVAAPPPPTVATTTAVKIGVPKKRIEAKKKTAPALTKEKTKTRIPQTASVYSASQQPALLQVGKAVYNGLHGFWTSLKKHF